MKKQFITKIVLIINYLAKMYQVNSYFDVVSKLTSNKWELYIIYKSTKHALDKTFKILLTWKSARMYI